MSEQDTGLTLPTVARTLDITHDLINAQCERAVQAEQQLQAARAEAAMLREALILTRDWAFLPLTGPGSVQERYGYNNMTMTVEAVSAQIDAALSGDAGAAFLAEHQAMRRVVEAALAMWNTNAMAAHDHASLQATDALYEALKAYDALSAPAAEPEVQP